MYYFNFNYERWGILEVIKSGNLSDRMSWLTFDM